MVTVWPLYFGSILKPSYCYLSFRSIFSVEERFATVDGWLDRALAFLPVGWADFAILLKELKSLDHSQRFIHAASKRQIVDDLVADNTIFVDQEQTSERDSVSHKDVVVPGNLFVKVGDQRVIDLSDTTLISRRISPGQMREMMISVGQTKVKSSG